jgi:hypothetical protein
MFPSVHEQFKTFFQRREWVSDDEYRRLIRELCIRAIYANYNVNRQPSNYDQIKQFVLEKLNGVPSYRIPDDETIERRIRETIDPKLYPLGIAPCIRIKEATYLPNPVMFFGEEREKLDKVIESFKS